MPDSPTPTAEDVQRQLQQIIDLVPIMIFAKDWEGRFLLANKALADAYGTTVQDILDTWQGDLEHTNGQVSRMLAEDREVMETGEARVIPHRKFVDAHGHERSFRVTKVPFRTGGDRPAVVGTAIETTEQLQAEERFQLAIEAAPCGMLMADHDGTIVLVNREIEEMFGYSREELIGQPSTILVPERLRDRHTTLRQRFLDDRRRHQSFRGRDLFGLRRDGTEFPVEVAMNTVRTRSGPVILTSVVDVTQRVRADQQIRALTAEMEQRVIDRTRELAQTNAKLQEEITERRRTEEKLRSATESLERANRLLVQQALRDQLTGLPNRRAFDAHFRAEIRRAARSRSTVAVMLIDLDHFKRLNDTEGHLVGDRSLAQTGQALADCMRRPGDFAARYGGEEFAVVLSDTDLAGAQVVADTIRHAITRAVHAPDAFQPVTASIGISIERITPDTEPDTFLAAADRALYRAKDRGRNRVEVEAWSGAAEG